MKPLSSYNYPEDPSEYLTVDQALRLKMDFSHIRSEFPDEKLNLNTCIRNIALLFNTEICVLPKSSAHNKSRLCYRTGLFYLLCDREEESNYYCNGVLPPFTLEHLNLTPEPTVFIDGSPYPVDTYLTALLKIEDFHKSTRSDTELNPNKFLPKVGELP